MTGRALKGRLERAFLSLGFERAGRSLARRGSGVWILVSFEKGFGTHWSINVKFWLEALGGERPERVELAHLVFRLERLVPEHHETITTACALEVGEQPEALAMLTTLLAGEIDAVLQRLGTEAGLREALADGRLSRGLVRHEARAWLLGA